MAYSEDAAKDLAAHVRGIQYAALDWHNELVDVMIAREHIPSFN